MKAKHILYGIGVVLLGGLIAGHVASAISEEEEVDIYFNINPSLKLTLSNDEIKIDSLIPGTAVKSSGIDVTAESNSAYGFSVFATVGDGETYTNTSLVNGEASFTSLGINDGVALTAMNENVWGYAQDGADSYKGFPYFTSTPTQIISSLTSGTKTTNIAIGARASSTQPAGEYTNIINFALIATIGD